MFALYLCSAAAMYGLMVKNSAPIEETENTHPVSLTWVAGGKMLSVVNGGIDAAPVFESETKAA